MLWSRWHSSQSVFSTPPRHPNPMANTHPAPRSTGREEQSASLSSTQLAESAMSSIRKSIAAQRVGPASDTVNPPSPTPGTRKSTLEERLRRAAQAPAASDTFCRNRVFTRLPGVDQILSPHRQCRRHLELHRPLQRREVDLQSNPSPRRTNLPVELHQPLLLVEVCPSNRPA
jgi:hypothetical protein